MVMLEKDALGRYKSTVVSDGVYDERRGVMVGTVTGTIYSVG